MQSTWDIGLIPGFGGSSGGGQGNPFQYSCLDDPMDRGAWQASVHRVAKRQIRLKRLSTAHPCWLLLPVRHPWPLPLPASPSRASVLYFLHEILIRLCFWDQGTGYYQEKPEHHISPFFLFSVYNYQRFFFFSKYCVLNCFSCAWLFATLWTMTGQAPLPMGFFRQEYRSGLTGLLQKIFQTQGSELNLLCLLHWQAGYLPLVKPLLKY